MNYGRHLSVIALHYHAVPIDIPLHLIDEYLYLIKTRRHSPSESYFKFTVYSLRYAYRMYGMKDKLISMPTLKLPKRLPVVLSKEEVKRLLSVPGSLKHKVLLELLYGCGLRSFELKHVKLRDLDFDRAMLHVRNGKGGRDRYVPMSAVLMRSLKLYISEDKPQTWLFNGKPGMRRCTQSDKRYSGRTIHWVVKQSCEKAEITKHISPHTLRHTFATHLLEDGLDIVTIKEMLGHVSIITTMIYLHVARCGRGAAFSPLDTLYGIREPEFKHGICPYFVNSLKQSGATQDVLAIAGDARKLLEANNTDGSN